VHPGSTWSGTYDVDADDPTDPERGTLLHPLDPIMAARTTFLSVGESSVPANFVINPKLGLMILIPSIFRMKSFRIKETPPRILIAFNLKRNPIPDELAR
jgi:hypothetical protein